MDMSQVEILDNLGIAEAELELMEELELADGEEETEEVERQRISEDEAIGLGTIAL